MKLLKGLTVGTWLLATGETLAGRAVAFAEGNALGKGPQILRLGPDDVAWIRRRAAAGDPVFMQLEVRHYFATAFVRCCQCCERIGGGRSDMRFKAV